MANNPIKEALQVQSDSFPRDGYGFTTNQISHATFIGFLGFVYGLTFLYFVVFGEFPYKWQIALFAALAYIAFELYTQGWNGWDTVEDWAFVNVYGVWGPLCTFTEQEVGTSKVTADLFYPLPFVILLCLHLLAGYQVRKWRSRQ